MFSLGDLVKTNESDITSIGIIVGVESWNSVFKSILEDDKYFEENIEENHSEIFTLSILENNVVSVNSIDPEFLGLHKSSLRDIQIKTKQDAVESFVNILNNTANQSMIETTALNAAGGLLVGNVVDSFEDGVELALNTIADGKAMNLLEKFVADTGDIEKLKEIVDG